jgi:uncharacterized membrane protein (UPF0127 family)
VRLSLVRPSPFTLGLGVLFLILVVIGINLMPTRLRAQGVPTGCATAPYAEVQIDGLPRINLELARTPQEHQLGLMNRTTLGPDDGMLFIYQSEATEGYWMYRTLLPLSIAWIDQFGTIVDIQDMPRLDNPEDQVEAARHVYTPAAPYWYALEVNIGWFAHHGVGVGQVVNFCMS